MPVVTAPYFPFPHKIGNSRTGGSVVPLSETCQACSTRPCESGKEAPGEIGLCSYGYNYLRLSQDLLVFGFVIRDYPQSTPARNKTRRRESAWLVGNGMVDTLIARYRHLGDIEAEAEKAIRAAAEAQTLSQADIRKRVVGELRDEARQALGQLHDYRQFVTQIIQNMNVIWQKQYPDLPTEEQLRRAPHEEVAIYEAARLMESKLRAWALFMEPGMITDRSRWGSVQIHQLLVKNVRIYQRTAESKGLVLRIAGESFGEIEGNGDALAVIPHTFIDNAIKYGPSGTEIVCYLEETAAKIRLEVSSFGPRIAADEIERIFLPFHRGRYAKAESDEGLGLGLALLSMVCDRMGFQTEVGQKRDTTHGDLVWTTFSVSMPRV